MPKRPAALDQPTAVWLARQARQAKIAGRHRELHLLFERQCRDVGILLVSEYPFAAPRKYRADYVVSSDNLMIEIEGGGPESHHKSWSGYEHDAEKYNLATCLGYRVIRGTAAMVEDGRLIGWVQRVIGAAGEA